MPGFEPFVIAVLVAIVASLLLRRYARRQLFEQRQMITDLALCARAC